MNSLNFDLDNISPSDAQVINIILTNYPYDLTPCLTNCTNQGMCHLDLTTKKYLCKCNENFIGSTCQSDTRPCAKNACLNNGTCANLANDTTFVCECQQNYFGVNCENEFNICQNKSCSANGRCANNQGTPTCICFTGYYGENCEMEASFTKVVRDVKLTSILICAFSIGFCVTLIILNDVWSIFIRKANAKHVRNSSRSFSNPKVIHFKYYAFSASCE